LSQGGARPVADVRALRPEDDLEAVLDVTRAAFGPLDAAARTRRLAALRAGVSGGRCYAAFEGPRPVAFAEFNDMVQWWHGRPVKMAGVGGVSVAPEKRGRGVGRALMTELLQVIAGHGYPLSALYPATAPIYRSLGWELAGSLYRGVIPARSLVSLHPAGAHPAGAHPAGAEPAGAEPALRRAGPADAEQVIAVIGAVHESARHCGPATRDVESVRRWLGEEDLFCYLAGDGFLAYGWQGDREILVRTALAGSAPTARAIWSVVGSHSSTADQVVAFLAPSDPVGWLTREPDVGLAQRWPWMLRVVDAAAAVSERGFPSAAELAVTLRLDDARLPRNAGLWTLRVGGGRGSFEPVITQGGAALPPAGPVRLGARGFAAMYAGVPMATLRAAGLAEGGQAAADEALDCAFAGTAFLLDEF
jgi:predicted N-acetyltransferase YhbS